MKIGVVAIPAFVALLLSGARLSGEQPVSELKVREGVGHVYTGSRCSGERRLNSLARETAREDSWLFGDGLWIDIGYGEGQRSVLCSWEPVRSVSGFHPEDGLIWYHVHPRGSAPTGVYPPSVEDILALGLLKRLCREELDAPLTARVFDGCGVWDLDLSEELTRRLGAAGIPNGPSGSQCADPRDTASLLVSPARRREVDALAFYLQHERASQAILRDRSIDRDELIRRYVSEMAGIGVVLSYTELSDELPEHD